LFPTYTLEAATLGIKKVFSVTDMDTGIAMLPSDFLTACDMVPALAQNYYYS